MFPNDQMASPRAEFLACGDTSKGLTFSSEQNNSLAPAEGELHRSVTGPRDAPANPLLPFEQLQMAKHIVGAEGQGLLRMGRALGKEICAAADQLYACRGTVIVCGMGKAGIIGQKIAATLSSTGTRSQFVHPSNAMHGDLGCIHQEDVVLILSLSGQTDEIARLLPIIRRRGANVIAITGCRDSPLTRAAKITLWLGTVREACPLGLAPSTSTTCMLAMGDALALVVSQMKRFTADDFSRNHPGGSLGQKLAKVLDVMRPISSCSVVGVDAAVREALIAQKTGKNPDGPILVVDDRDQLKGIFTDWNLAGLLEGRCDDALDARISDVMTTTPATVNADTGLSVAYKILATEKLRELPVVRDGRLVGLIRVADVVEHRW